MYMSNRFSSFIKKIAVGKNMNLVSLDEPYGVIAGILRDRRITGILDAGASNGRITKRLLGLFPGANAYAFEPNPLYRDVLERCASEDKHFRPVFMALSDREGSIDLHVTESPGSTSLFPPGKRTKELDPDGSSIKSVEQVEMITLDKWAEQNAVKEIQLMKFDIQGGELDAFRGAANMLRHSTLAVYTEILFNPMYEGGAIYSDIDLCLREYGFILYDIFKPKYDRNRLLMWGNAIFIQAERLGL